MDRIIPIVANSMVLFGLLVLLGTLFQVRKLIKQLANSPLRKKWLVQAGLICIFITGYLSYAVAFWGDISDWTQLIVPGIFFFGALFVWITISLSLQTAIDIRRVTLLEQENITDPLLGIYNRRYLDRRIVEEYSRAKRYQNDLSLLLIDLDNFKAVNDQHGHPVGDQVLRLCANLVLDNVRSSDTVARYGGDEIMVIAPLTPISAAVSLAERIRSSMSEQQFVLSCDNTEQIEIQITASIGIAHLTLTTENLETLICEADRALYEAKKEGRNRVLLGTMPQTEPAASLRGV